jgi:hypothetical protein
VTAALRTRRLLQDRLFLSTCLVLTSLSLVVLCLLLSSVISQGWRGLIDVEALRAVFAEGRIGRIPDLVRWNFFSEYASRKPLRAGIRAPLLVVGIPVFIACDPEGPMSPFTVLPFQIFNWAGRPQPAFHQLAASAIIVLLLALLSFNALAIYLRHRLQSRSS